MGFAFLISSLLSILMALLSEGISITQAKPFMKKALLTIKRHDSFGKRLIIQKSPVVDIGVCIMICVISN